MRASESLCGDHICTHNAFTYSRLFCYRQLPEQMYVFTMNSSRVCYPLAVADFNCVPTKEHNCREFPFEIVALVWIIIGWFDMSVVFFTCAVGCCCFPCCAVMFTSLNTESRRRDSKTDV